MAQYEATSDQIEQLTAQDTGLSDAVKEAIAQLSAAADKTVAVVTGTVSSSNADAVVTGQGTTLNNATFNQATAIVVDSTSGNATAQSQEAVTADLVNSSVNLEITNNANNTVNISGATGGGVKAGDGNNEVTVTDGKDASVELGNGNNKVSIDGEQGAENVSLTVGDGNNNVSVQNATNTSITMGSDSGTGRQTLTLSQDTGTTVEIKGKGNNELTLDNSTDASVTTGDGDDLMNLQGAVSGTFKTGAGNLEMTLDQTAQEQAEISVDAGEGFDMLRLLGNAVKHLFQFVNGKFHMHSADVTMEGVNVVSVDANQDNKITLDQDSITVLATNEEDSLVAKLYKVALGRQAIDGEDGWGNSTLGGINWWMNEFEKAADNDGSTEHLVRSFLNCDEFHNKYDSMSNEEYVNTLFDNLGSTDADMKAEYLSKLNSGRLDREEVAWQLADSDEAVKLLGADGENYVIDGFTTESNS